MTQTNAQHTEWALQIPAWRILTRVELRGSAASATCERCNSHLSAEAWSIEERSTGRIWTVGSTCVKLLTGHTISQLDSLNAGYQAGMAAEEEGRNKARILQAFIAANIEQLAWLEAHIEKVHAIAERILTERGGKLPGIGEPSLPTATFWEELRERGRVRGSWTAGELAAIKREMDINTSAPLAAVKTKGEFAGIVGRAKVSPGFEGKGFVVQFDLQVEGGAVYVARASTGTGFFDALDAAFLGHLSPARHTGNALAGNSAGISERIARDLAQELPGKNLELKGTVKAQRQIGGVAYLTRCALLLKVSR